MAAQIGGGHGVAWRLISAMTEHAMTAPPAEFFPAYPASWYLFCESHELAGKPYTRRVLGRDLVAFRTSRGIVSILDAHCSHLGADLGCGQIVGDAIQCPFHNWRYAADGQCIAVSGAARVPAFARQHCYPVEERHGYVFFFNGKEPLFPLPFFFGADPDAFVAAHPFRYVADCSWYMNSAHAFDTQHFLAVHDRELVAPPETDCPAPFARRNRYRAKVLGKTRLDRWLQTLAGDMVNISITVWGGTYVLVTGDFDRAQSRFLIATRPLDDASTLCEGIVFAPRGRHTLARALDPVALRIRRHFTYGYLLDETTRLRGTRYNPASLGPPDRDMIAFFQWLAALPQNPHEPAVNAAPIPVSVSL
jgi:nitrite reductase/ring-hydroxylating ferredoxin subunit